MIPPGARPLEDAEREALLTDLASVVETSHLFKSLDEDGRAQLIRAGYVVFLDKDQTLISEGEEGTTMYLVLDGRLRVETKSPAGLVQLAELGRGACIGEVSVLTDGPRTATVSAIAPSQCVAFEKHRILRVIDAHPRVRQILETLIEGRARDTVEKIIGS